MKNYSIIKVNNVATLRLALFSALVCLLVIYFFSFLLRTCLPAFAVLQ